IILIDDLDCSQGTVIQGFVPAGRVGTFDLVSGSVYNLSNFFGSRSKNQYRVADHVATVSFSWNTSLAVLENPPVLIPDDRFRFHSYEEFKANCDSKGDLYECYDSFKFVNIRRHKGGQLYLLRFVSWSRSVQMLEEELRIRRN
ncbi:unnamed protein product, partial [Brassica oleracea]